MELALPMSSPFKAPEFKKLFKEWNERLKQSGFQDAEDFNLPEPALKSWHSLKWENERAEKRSVEATHYFELAQDVLHTFPFKTDVHRRTWELHCQGLSVRQISDRLDFQLIGYKGKKRANVQLIIAAIQKAAGIKHG
jgi:hypothetical protein